uniref:Ig-like domain-containing protein n=1 Tax=Megaselia scalaris TaxID=36166 RepID=T1GIB3_MEGSC
INNVEDTDKGAYKLIAKNEKGEAVSQIVNLVDIPEPEVNTKPEISQKLTDKKVAEASTFELVVILKQSDKKCKVSWYKGTTIIKETKDITTTFDGKTARLTFSSAKMEYTSTYKVVVSNEIGQDESSCKITVEKVDEKKKQKEEKEKKEKAQKEQEERRKEEEEEKKKIEEEKKVEEQKKIEEQKKVEE